MASIINASTSSGLAQSADTSGNLELQSDGSTKLTVASTGVTIPTLTTTTLTGTTVTGTITLGTPVATTSGTSIDFTGIPSWVKKITVQFFGVSVDAAANLLLQIGDSGGIENTGYVAIANTPSTNTSDTTGFILTASPAAADAMYGQVVLSLMNSSNNSWVSNGMLSSTGNTARNSGGGKSLSATLDRLRITSVGGTATFDAGSINIQYEG